MFGMVVFSWLSVVFVLVCVEFVCFGLSVLLL